MDISSIQSLYNRFLRSSATPTTTGTHFADYFFNATAKVEQDKDNTNSLFNDLSGFGTSSALQGLLNGHTDAVSSYLNASTSRFSSPTATETFSSYLQTNFQSKQLRIMQGAKDRLTAQMTAFEEKMSDKDEAAVLRLVQMKQNIATVEGYLADKQQQQTVKNNLLNKLQSSSAFTHYLLTQQKSQL